MSTILVIALFFCQIKLWQNIKQHMAIFLCLCLSSSVSLPLLRWSAKLYLTPSNSVLLTAIALIGVCVFILVIIGILHWQEKVRTHTHRHRVACCS